MERRAASIVVGLLLCALARTALTEPPAARSADQIYQTYCAACHATGWNGAPMAGIRSDWTPRLAHGPDAILRNVKQGLGTMPPMGTCTDCSDEELRAAIEQMLGQ